VRARTLSGQLEKTNNKLEEEADFLKGCTSGEIRERIGFKKKGTIDIRRSRRISDPQVVKIVGFEQKT